MKTTWQGLARILKRGGVAVIPTDTLYGIVGSALNKKTVERIYTIKSRDERKPFIILITSYKDLEKFGVMLPQDSFKKFWPGKVSVVLPCTSAWGQKKFAYLHRGTYANSFRMVGPRNKNLFNLIRSVGPLVAPSANPQGLAPALNVRQARKYFGNKVDAYICGGARDSLPSTLVEYKDGEFKVLRQGSVIVK